jgi:hypothetical protein
MTQSKVEDIVIDINGKPIEFKGSPKIKRKNTKIALSKEHLEEYIKCQNDILYFAEHYVKIIDPDLGLSLIKLYDYQEDLLNQFKDNRDSIILSSRQSGKSTTSAIFIMWYTIFNKDKSSAILANKEKTAVEIFGRVMTVYENLPNFLKPGVSDFSKTLMTFDNGSKILAASTSSSTIRGFTINGCVTLDTYITIRNKKTKKIEKLQIIDFINKILKKDEAILLR